MSANLLNRSLVLKKAGLVSSLVPLDTIKNVILTYFESTNPVINQFPDFTVFILPEKQFSLTVQNETIAITDNPQLEDGNLDEVLKIASKLCEELEQYPLYAYGINHTFLVENANVQVASKYLNSSALEEDAVISSEDSLAVLNYGFLDRINENTKRQFVLNFLLNEQGAPTENLQVSANLHNDNTPLPDFATLIRDVQNEHALVLSKINKMTQESGGE